MLTYFDFAVSLDGIKPRIWRRFLLARDATFLDLHQAIQDAAPWDDYHLFAFSEPGRRGREIAASGEDGSPVPAARVPLAAVFANPKDKCLYTYDFGDGWRHTVELKGIKQEPETFHRRLTGGARAFPPEDCGGAWGYGACLAAVGALDVDEADLCPEMIEERREWLDPEWDPEAFDLAEAAKVFDEAARPGPRLGPSHEDVVDEDEGDEDEPWPEEDDSHFGPSFVDQLLEFVPRMRVPRGLVMPACITPHAREKIRDLPGMDPAWVAAMDQADPEDAAVGLTIDQARALATFLRNQTRGRDRTETDGLVLEIIASRLADSMALYEEADLDKVGRPRDAAAGPMDAAMLKHENAMLHTAGLIDTEELARRIDARIADPRETLSVRLTIGQRRAFAEAFEMPPDVEARFALDSKKAEDVPMEARELAWFQIETSEILEEMPTGSLHGRLGRGLARIEKALEGLLVPLPGDEVYIGI